MFVFDDTHLAVALISILATLVLVCVIFALTDDYAKRPRMSSRRREQIKRRNRQRRYAL